MKKLTFLLMVFIVNLTTVFAQKDGLKAIRQREIRSYMEFLASDEMRGRETGSPENNIAALYIATNLERMGIRPVPGNSGYWQDVPMVSHSVLKDSTFIEGTDAGNTRLVRSDSVLSLVPAASDIDVSGNLVFAGYGVKDTAMNYNDLRNIDIAGKVVMIMTRKPGISDDPKYRDGYRFSESLEVPKVMSLVGKRAKAILIVYDAKNLFHDAYRSGLADMLGGKSSVSLADRPGMAFPMKIFFITGTTADRLLSSSGNTLRQLQEKIDDGKKPASFDVPGVKVSVKIATHTEKFTAHNVIGFVEGSDPVLKSECVVVSAHYDHIGVNDKGEVFNGADDNASGTTGLLEVASAFQNCSRKPARSMIFLWVTGEEKGLLGSQYYVNHPFVPMEKTKLDINLDMIGRSVTPADTGLVMGFKPDVTAKDEVMLYNDGEQFLGVVRKSSQVADIKVTVKGKNLAFGGSDHMSFSSRKVPFLFFHSGIHRDLHAITDDVAKIDFDKMEKVSKLVFLTGYSIANSKMP
jgi:Zn-dependent M28 family amino/carboxypeptidase